MASTAFKRITIRSKKSLSGLYPSSNDHAPQGPEATVTAEKASAEPPSQYDLNKFGMPSNENASPDRDSYSRRTRLLGSLRSIGSLRSLRSIPCQSKQSHSEGSTSEAESPRTPVKEMPSLALDFEVSPPDKPMFDTVTRQVSNSSSLEVLHSSPLPVSQANKQVVGPCSISPRISSLVTGHPPESPAPLQRMSVQESILSRNLQPAVEESSDGSPIGHRPVEADPNPTPLPGTNLTFDDAGELATQVQCPSASSLYQDYLNLIPAECGSQGQVCTTMLSDPLSIDDPKFDEMVAMASAKDSTNMLETLPKQRHPQPYCDASVPVTGNFQSSVSRKSSPPHQHTISQDSAAAEKLPDDFTHTFWNAATIADENSARQEHRPRARNWYSESRQNTRCSSGETYLAAGQESSEISLATHRKETMNKTAQSVTEPWPRSTEEDKKELQHIIRYYAWPMLYRSDALEEQDNDVVSEFLAGDNSGIEQVAKEEIRAEVEFATRVMNRSLGG